MTIVTIGESLILLLIIILVGSSALKEFTLRRLETPIIIRFFGAPLVFNIAIILIILFPTIFRDFISNYNILSLNNLYICILIVFLIYQSYVSSEILIFSHGIFYLGNYIRYDNIKRIELVQIKNKYSIELISDKTVFNVSLNLKNATKFYELMREHNINIYN